MKRLANQAMWLILLGGLLVGIGFDPALTLWGNGLPFFHAMEHVVLFLGSCLFFYGLETLRKLATTPRIRSQEL